MRAHLHMHLYCRLLLLSLLGACSIVATAAFGWLHLDIRSVVTHSIFFPKSNIHRDDVDLAFSLANQSGSAPSHIMGDGSNVLAFLFMIKDHIVHEEYWRLFFQSMADDSFQIYIHATAPSSEVSVDLGQNVVPALGSTNFKPKAGQVPFFHLFLYVDMWTVNVAGTSLAEVERRPSTHPL